MKMGVEQAVILSAMVNIFVWLCYALCESKTSFITNNHGGLHGCCLFVYFFSCWNGKHIAWMAGSWCAIERDWQQEEARQHDAPSMQMIKSLPYFFGKQSMLYESNICYIYTDLFYRSPHWWVSCGCYADVAIHSPNHPRLYGGVCMHVCVCLQKSTPISVNHWANDEHTRTRASRHRCAIHNYVRVVRRNLNYQQNSIICSHVTSEQTNAHNATDCVNICAPKLDMNCVLLACVPCRPIHWRMRNVHWYHNDIYEQTPANA